jgi:hypothetical protein
MFTKNWSPKLLFDWKLIFSDIPSLLFFQFFWFFNFLVVKIHNFLIFFHFIITNLRLRRWKLVKLLIFNLRNILISLRCFISNENFSFHNIFWPIVYIVCNRPPIKHIFRHLSILMRWYNKFFLYAKTKITLSSATHQFLRLQNDNIFCF